LPLPACTVNFIAFANVLDPGELEAEVCEAARSGHHSLMVCEQLARNDEVFGSFAQLRTYFPNAALLAGAEEGGPQFTALLKIYHPSSMDASWLQLASAQASFQLQLLVHEQYAGLGRRLLKDLSLLLGQQSPATLTNAIDRR